MIKKLRLYLSIHVLLSLIIIFAAFLRFYQIGILPPSLTWDEVALGYNAYSLGIDGRDEFGKLLPINYLISFGDYKPPVYAYLDIIPIKVFGLTEFAVRFPSALLGTLSVLVTYFLVKELFISRIKSKNESDSYRKALAITSAFFLAISPWHIMLSRAAFEANVAEFFILTGVWLFFRALNREKYLLILSIILFIVSMYTFNSARIVAPVLFFVLILGNIRSIWKIKKVMIATCIIGFLLVVPLTNFLASPEAKLRYAEVNIFSDVKIVETANQEIINDKNAWWSKIIHNRRIAYFREAANHYFDHFNPSFLFIHGDVNPKFSTQDQGQMYLWDLPFLIIGIFLLFRKKQGHWWIIPLWLLIGILPAAVARETPHALRIESSLPTWQILSAFGFINFLNLFNKYKYKMGIILGLLLFISVLYFQHGYFTHYTKEYAQVWQYGYKDVIKYVRENESKYDQIIISNQLERAYIYTLFYLKYNPLIFRNEVRTHGNDFGFVHVDNFGKYYFSDNPQDLTGEQKKTLYIVGIKQVPDNQKILKEFKDINGKTNIVSYTNLK